jgi:hypothetical protein
VDFPNRAYALGETIDIDVGITSKADASVNEGRVDLVCKERYAETFTKMERVGLYPKGKTPPKDMFAKREVKVLKESYVHSSTVFLENARLQPGAPARYSTRLVIQPEPPRHAKVGTATWTLEATVRIESGDTVSQTRKVNVAAT